MSAGSNIWQDPKRIRQSIGFHAAAAGKNLAQVATAPE